MERWAEYVPTFLVLLARVAAFMRAAPLTGEQRIPPKARIAAASLISLAFVGVHPPMTESALYVQLPLEVGFGLLAGFTARVVLAGLEVGGELIGMQMGLGFAGTFDPSLGDMALPMRRIVFVLAAIAFVSLGGFQNIARLALLPPVDAWTLLSVYGALMQRGSELFMVGIHFAIPILVAITVANIAMGLANRAAPALNVYSVMLSVTGVLGAVVMLAASPMMAQEITTIALRAVQAASGGL